MRVAVVTPTLDTPGDVLRRCLESVRAQAHPCDHVVVNDGGAWTEGLAPGALVVHLPRPHGDTGNAARAVGSVEAIAAGYDAIAYLDADNWYEPDHVAGLVALHGATGAPVLSSARDLYTPGGELLGRCPEVDGDRHVDTSCLMLARAAFPAAAFWALVPPALRDQGDRYVWACIGRARLARAHRPEPTVGYRTRYRAHYEYFGLPAPPGAKG